MKRTLVWNSWRSTETSSSTSASTVASSPVVGSSRISSDGVLGERHRDHDALLHAARELVRVAPHDAVGVGDLHLAQHLPRPLVRLLGILAGDHEHLGHLVADPDRRVQRPARVLVDHRDLRGAQLAHLRLAQVRQVLAGHLDRAARDAPVARQVAQHGVRRGRLAAARLAHQPVGLPLGDGEVDAAQDGSPDAAHAVGDLEVGELECGGRRDGGGVGHRSKAEATPSAIRFTPMTSVAIARLGNRTGHQKPPEMRP